MTAVASDRPLGDGGGPDENGLLVGTWRDAWWAVRFYEHNGFRVVPGEQAAALLRRYWNVPERQIAASVVLADERWSWTEIVRSAAHPRGVTAG